MKSHLRANSRRILLSVTTAAAVWTLAGCGAGDAAGMDAFVVRDSAGIAIAENQGHGIWAAGAGWRLSAEPTVQIGVLSGAPEYQLYQPRGALRLSDGRIVVANAGTHELRYYDASGTHLRSVGGEGGGPGEFKEIFGFGSAGGDSVYVWDFRSTRLSIFDPDGTFVTAISMADELDAALIRLRGVYSDGSFLLDAGFNLGGAAGMSEGSSLSRDTVGYLRVGRDGVPLDTLGPFPGDEQVTVLQTSDNGLRIWLRGLPFGRKALISVEDTRAYVALSGRWEVRVYSSAGQLELLIRLDRARMPVTPEDITAQIEDILAGIEDENERRSRRATLESLEFPDLFPAFSGMRVDAGGNIWLREYERPTYKGPRRWNIFNPDGRLLGVVETPARFGITQIGPDFVLGIARNDLGLARVRLFELVKPPGEAD